MSPNHNKGFVGTLSDVEFEEVTIDRDTFVSTPVAGGEVHCISDDFDAFPGNECTNAGDECELGNAVENPALSCVYVDTERGVGVCQVPAGTCVDGASNVDANGCDRTVTCDGVEFTVECPDGFCLYITVGGTNDAAVESDDCSRDDLRLCGAPIPL